MGRKRKFGEESDFVSVRVPKSKRQEYRETINNFVEKKFATENTAREEDHIIQKNKNEFEKFRKFEEFVKDIKNLQEEKEEIILKKEND
ncbi:MAG: hypothetical protein ACFFA0_06355 [Promethearchaeota archaeon]